jgi:regulatory protein
LGLLAVRSRSRQELRARLRRAGFDDEEIDRTLGELEEAGLIDDRRFAAELVRDQAGRRMAGARAIRTALRQKGVSQDVADEALAEIDQGEEERARRLAEIRARRLEALGPEAAYRRIVGLLLRRGYGSAVARRAALQAVSPAEDELDLSE